MTLKIKLNFIYETFSEGLLKKSYKFCLFLLACIIPFYNGNAQSNSVSSILTSFPASTGLGSGGQIYFGVQNEKSYPIRIDSISCSVGSSPSSYSLWYNQTLITAVPTVVSTINGWLLKKTWPSVSGVSGQVKTVLNGINLVIPSNSTYKFSITGNSGLSYRTWSPLQPGIFTNDSVSLLVNYSGTSGSVSGYSGIFPSWSNGLSAFVGKVYYTVLSPGKPDVVNLNVTNVFHQGARVFAFINNDSALQVSSSGILISTTPGADLTTPGAFPVYSVPLVIMDTFSVNVSGLSPLTTYYYRAFATNAAGTSFAPDSQFTTLGGPVLPQLSSPVVINRLTHSVSVSSSIVFDGGAAVNSSGIVLSAAPNPSPGLSGSFVFPNLPLITSGSFTLNATGLTPNTKYYIRSFAENSVGFGFSNEDSFLTEPLIIVYPYFENFDSIHLVSGWHSGVASGSANDWQLCSPSKSFITSARSLPNCWVTNQYSNYSNNQNSYLISPVFDFSAFVSDPVLAFSHNFATESGYDGAVIELDVNNSGIWIRIDSAIGSGPNYLTGNGTNWYNSSVSALPGIGFSDYSIMYPGQNAGWINSQNILTGAAGKSNVRIRFRFSSDFVYNDDGWAIDNIQIYESQPPILATGNAIVVNAITAIASGSVISNGGAGLTVTGVVIGQNPNPVLGMTGVIDSTTSVPVSTGLFSVTFAGLTPGTLYYYRTFAINAIGIGYGPDSAFITPTTVYPPSVNTGSLISVTTSSAVISGNIISNGGGTIANSGLLISTSPAPTTGTANIANFSTSPTVSLGIYSNLFTGLNPGTKYYFRAYAENLAGISYGQTDSFLTLNIISVYPYYQDFDSTVNDWNAISINGMANDWMLGSPSKTNISSAYSGSHCWVTDTSRFYSDNSDAALVSPVFDFSQFYNDPVLSFYLAFQFEAGYDGAVLEMSLDGGNTWNNENDIQSNPVTGNTRFSSNWYNGDLIDAGSFGNAWTSPGTYLFRGWFKSQTRLIGAAGQSDVRLRFHYTTDPPYMFSYKGWAIDNIEVKEVNTPTIPATMLNLINIGRDTCTVIWINGNGENRIVVASLPTSPVYAPVDSSVYDFNVLWGGFASHTGAGNQVVYDGNANSVKIYGLTQATAYTFTVYEYNGSLMHTRYLVPGTSVTGSTLPVQLLKFTGKRNGNDVNLNWQTGSEINNKFFVIERSLNGVVFDSIGFIRGSSNSNVLVNYKFTDRNVFNNYTNEIYYRLKQIDIDEACRYSWSIKLNGVESDKNEFNIFPNPLTSTASISYSLISDEIIEIEIVNILGEKVHAEKKQVNSGFGSFEISNSDLLPNGIYFVYIRTQNGESNFRLIKQ